MDPAVLLVPAALAVAGGAGWLAWEYEQRRRRAWAALAQARGWQYALENPALADAFAGEPFGTGRRRRATDVLTGAWRGRPMAAFTYSFQTTTSGSPGQQQTQTHRYGVLALRTPGFLPQIELTPQNVLTRVAGALGFAGVELESEDFHARYRVTAQDPRLAYDVLHPRAMQLLLDRPPVAVRLLGADAVSWDSGRLDAGDLLVRLETVSDLLDAVPQRVWADHGGTAA
ncbi:MAG: hypothetical protein JWN57_29 [Frankiales bacterium]|nr:hypothetical protein [Frankiales bacterium]